MNDEDYKEIADVAVERAFEYAMNRINHFGLFSGSELTDVQRGMDSWIREVVEIERDAMFNNADSVVPRSIEEAIELAESAGCDFVDNYIEEQRRGQPVDQSNE